MSASRAEVWRRLGPPDDQEGSANDPREYEDGGVHWNERWCYRLPEGEERWVLWARADLEAILRRRADGRVEREIVAGIEPDQRQLGSASDGEAGE